MKTLVFVLVIVLLIMFFYPKEHFDTYWNHSIGAQDIYQASKDPIQQNAAKHMKDAETLASYTWSQKEPNGMQLYDHYYDTVLLDNQISNDDPTYYARDLETSYLDSKFQTLNANKGFDAAAGNFSHYDAAGMLDPNPMYTVYNGEYISLSQKSF